MLATSPVVPAAADRCGMCLSTLCAIHCLAAPVASLTLPSLGLWWSSPWVHATGAAVVIPLALIVLGRGQLQHQRRWPILAGVVGSIALLVALLPAWSEIPGIGWAWGGATWTQTPCCPVIDLRPDGGAIYLPLASILTIAGSLLLVVGHAGNMACRRSCARTRMLPQSTAD